MGILLPLVGVFVMPDGSFAALAGSLFGVVSNCRLAAIFCGNFSSMISGNFSATDFTSNLNSSFKKRICPFRDSSSAFNDPWSKRRVFKTIHEAKFFRNWIAVHKKGRDKGSPPRDLESQPAGSDSGIRLTTKTC